MLDLSRVTVWIDSSNFSNWIEWELDLSQVTAWIDSSNYYNLHLWLWLIKNICNVTTLISELINICKLISKIINKKMCNVISLISKSINICKLISKISLIILFQKYNKKILLINPRDSLNFWNYWELLLNYVRNLIC